MSLPLESLIYKTLGIGQGKVFAVELPNSDDSSVAYRIQQYCKQLDRPCLILEGASVDKHSVLEKLRALFGTDEASGAFNSPSYRSIKNVISRHRTGVLCINSAHELTPKGEQLLSQLVHFARKNKLAWKFYFLAKRCDEASQLNANFGVRKRLMWSERQQDWFFVEKADITDTKISKKASVYKSLAIAIAALVGAYLFLVSQPKPQDLLMNNPPINEHATKGGQ